MIQERQSENEGCGGAGFRDMQDVFRKEFSDYIQQGGYPILGGNVTYRSSVWDGLFEEVAQRNGELALLAAYDADRAAAEVERLFDEGSEILSLRLDGWEELTWMAHAVRFGADISESYQSLVEWHVCSVWLPSLSRWTSNAREDAVVYEGSARDRLEQAYVAGSLRWLRLFAERLTAAVGDGLSAEELVFGWSDIFARRAADLPMRVWNTFKDEWSPTVMLGCEEGAVKFWRHREASLRQWIEGHPNSVVGDLLRADRRIGRSAATVAALEGIRMRVVGVCAGDLVQQNLKYGTPQFLDMLETVFVEAGQKVDEAYWIETWESWIERGKYSCLAMQKTNKEQPNQMDWGIEEDDSMSGLGWDY